MLDTWGLPILKQEFRKRGFGLKLETCQFESIRFGQRRFVLDSWGLPIGVHEFMKAKGLGSNLRPAKFGSRGFGRQFLWDSEAVLLEGNHLCWRLEARQFLEHQFWKASACVGDLRPRKFSACVLGSECVCVCVGIAGLGNVGSRSYGRQPCFGGGKRPLEGKSFWWTFGAWQLEAEVMDLCCRLEA